MRNKLKIIITTFIIFLILGTGIFTYFSVYEKFTNIDKYVIKTINYEEYIVNKPHEEIKLFNNLSKEYDTYKLYKVNFNEIVGTSKDIIKEVKKYSNIKLEKKDFSDQLVLDSNTTLKLKNIIFEPILIKDRQWHDETESIIRIYNNIQSADLINIPKEIYENNDLWYLLTDTVKFDRLDDKFNCKATYFRIKRVEEEKIIIDGYLNRAIYTGKNTIYQGSVTLKYKHSGSIGIKTITQQFSYKLLYNIIIITMSIIIIEYLYIKLKKIYNQNINN